MKNADLHYENELKKDTYKERSADGSQVSTVIETHRHKLFIKN